MFDVFYLGNKAPRLFAHERAADSISHAQELSRTRYCWIVSYLADYTGFDFLWEPPPWQAHQRHAWASQWQKDSGTYLIPKTEFADTNYHSYRISMQSDMSLWENIDSVEKFDFTWHPDYSDPPFNYEFGTHWQKTGGPKYPMVGAQHVKYLSQSGSKIRAKASSIYLIDHLDGTVDQFPCDIEKCARYFDNYKDTLTRISKNIPDEQEFVWICSSICDYTNFDFTWHPEAWQNHMLHVFPSDDQKFGDTFFMHVPTFRAKIEEFELLEWYDLNFVSDISVPRKSLPVIVHRDDSHVSQINKTTLMAPLTLLTSCSAEINTVPAVNLWRTETKAITPLRPDHGIVIVPRECKNIIRDQLYDYPVIDKTYKNHLSCTPLDVIFISYDESEADTNWQKLIARFPRARRVHGVAGMDNALLAAAECSTTAWFYTVFGKTEIAPDFGFDHYPDYFQQPKHYIFYSKIRANGLCYGEMGLIMYNRAMVINNHGKEFGLDYTMSFPHEVVPVVSTLGNFDTSPYQSWRTAFRETSKLAYFQHINPSVENEYHLEIWQSHAVGPYAEWVLRGAKDGYAFWEESQADVTILKQGFAWQWLRKRFVDRYGELD